MLLFIGKALDIWKTSPSECTYKCVQRKSTADRNYKERAGWYVSLFDGECHWEVPLVVMQWWQQEISSVVRKHSEHGGHGALLEVAVSPWTLSKSTIPENVPFRLHDYWSVVWIINRIVSVVEYIRVIWSVFIVVWFFYTISPVVRVCNFVVIIIQTISFVLWCKTNQSKCTTERLLEID